MREFFRGWKPKAGVVTLVLSCLLVTGWIRSGRSLDLLQISMGDSTVQMISMNGQIISFQMSPVRIGKFFRTYSAPLSPEVLATPWDVFDPSFRKDAAGFVLAFGKHQFHRDARFQLVIVPYWAVVVPMTLLSTWLLLSRRPEKPLGGEMAPVGKDG